MRTAPHHLLLAVSLALLAACDSAPQRPRAVVIGIDSADWRIVEPMIEDGRMPHLAALRERGTSGPIQTLVDFPLSPVIWTSVATGKTPAKHGITWFLVDRPDGSRVPVRSHNRRSKAIWNILADRDRRVTSVGWWATYPAEDIGPGTLVSDALGYHGFGRTSREGDDGHKVHPPDRFAELDALVPPEHQVSAAFAQRFLHLSDEQFRNARFDPARHAKSDPGNPLHLFQQYAVTAQGYTAIAEQLLSEPYDLFLLYYEQVDSFSHLFMKYTEPKLEWIHEDDQALFQDAVAEWYAYQDELLGRVLEKIDLDTTAVFVVSDHGFKSGERRIRSEKAVDIDTAHLDHEPDGVFLAAGPGIRHGERIEGVSVLDVTPTLLHYLALPVAKDMDGRVLTGIFDAERAIAYVPTYENEGDAAPPVVGEDYSEEELAENLAALETLGYVRGAEPAKDAPAGESSPELHNNMARIHLRAGDLDLAEGEFEAALELRRNDADALLGLSDIAAMRGNFARAEHLAKVAVASNPDAPFALAQLANLRRDAGDLDECTRLYREALALHESIPSLYLGLGDCEQRAGHYDEAGASFTRARELEPDSVAAVYNLGVVAFQQGDETEAIARYEEVLALAPDHPLAAAALNNLGTVHHDRGETEQAIERWSAAAEASPAQLEARVNLAMLYLDAGRVDDAVPLLEQAAALAPNHELLHTRLGRAYLEQGRGDNAYRALTLVHRLYPENWFAPLGLAVLHAATDRPDAARPLLDEAFRLGGEVAREVAAGYPALAPLLASAAPSE